MSQPLPSRQRKAWLPPSLSAVRYPAIPRPTTPSATTIQSDRPAPGAAACSAGGGCSFAIGPRCARGGAFCARIIARSIAEPVPRAAWHGLTHEESPMIAARLHDRSGAASLVCEDAPMPEAQDGEVL